MKISNYENINEDFYKKIEYENISSVNEIIKAVKEKGDVAVKEYANKFGDGEINEVKVTKEEIEKAIKETKKETIEAIEYAIENVKEFAKAQKSTIKETEVEIRGNILGQRIIPIEIKTIHICYNKN